MKIVVFEEVKCSWKRSFISYLPTAEELPHTDDVPVDSELQDKISQLLDIILNFIWADRSEWFFGKDMGWHYDPDQPYIAPDGFLCLGVPRVKGTNLRPSYVSWEERGVVPIFALEIVSKTPGGEYKRQKNIYAQQGVLYYTIYAPLRTRKRRLYIYRLHRGQFELLPDNPVWMPEVGLGIGTERGTYQGTSREWLYWYDDRGQRYATPDELLARYRQLFGELPRI